MVLGWNWRCSWSSANRRCSNYIWVINNFIAYLGVTYIRDFTVFWCPILLSQEQLVLTHWGRVHICVSKLSIIGSDNGLSPGRRQAIIWTNAGILLIRTLGTNFSEILGEIHSFSFSKMHLKMSSATWLLFGLGLNELRANTNRELQWLDLNSLWLSDTIDLGQH